MPDADLVQRILKARLTAFDTRGLAWDEAAEAAVGLSPAEVVRSAENAAKSVVLAGRKRVTLAELKDAIAERREATLSS